jgi:hypothetical protein
MIFHYAAPARNRWTGSGETFVSPIYLITFIIAMNKSGEIIPVYPITRRYPDSYQRIRLT